MDNVTEAYTDSKTGKFTKGNPGRPKGIKDKRVKRWDDLGEYLVSKGAERVMNLMDEMDDEDFIKHFKDLMSYFKPKLSTQQIDANINSQHTQISITAPQPKRQLEGKQSLEIDEAEVIPDKQDSKQS